MSKSPSRAYCSACKKLAHGDSCQKGKCGCKCRWMTTQQIDMLMKGKKDSEFVFSDESNEEFEKLLESWKNN